MLTRLGGRHEVAARRYHWHGVCSYATADISRSYNHCSTNPGRARIGPRKSLGLDFPDRIHCEHSFFGKPGKQHADRGHVLFNRGRRGPALQRFDIRGNRDWFNVFEVLIPSALRPGQEVLDCPVVGGSCVSVANRNRKKFEELFAVDGPARVMRVGVAKDC
jgi:hypothetical protein